MLLGYEFDLISSIASSFRSHSHGKIQFDKVSYLSHFGGEDPNLEYLEKLEREGLVNVRNNLITIDIHIWAEFFARRLEATLSHIGFNFKCNYDKTSSKLMVSKSEEAKIEFFITSENLIPQEDMNFISLCYINASQEYYLHWLELLNDYNTLELFGAFIKEETNRLNYKNRLTFNFFEGLDKGDLNEIFYTSIKNYLEDAGYTAKDASEIQQQLLKKITKNELYNLYVMEKNGNELVVLKDKEKIEFTLIKNELEIHTFPQEILSLIRQMEEKILGKINEYRKITRLNQFKLFDNTRKTVQILSLLLVPLNGLMLLGNTLNITFLKDITQNMYFYWASIMIFIFVFGFSAMYIVKPVYHLSKFSWKL
ncbi:TPA: hypothetical protein QCR38_003870 [Bacillus cereus]|nr:hypothetical protein [Bacillus cereus]